jgi:autotransporter-associated beta strand protein
VIGDGVGVDTVRLGASNQIADSRSVTLNQGGVFNLADFAETIGGLNSAAAGAQVRLGTGALTVNSATANTYAGTFTGTGALTKTGVGRLTLSGSSGSFTGTTHVNAGIVALGSATALGTGAVNIAPGGNVELQGNATVANAFFIQGEGTGALDGAIENFSGNNTLSGNVTLANHARIGSSGGTLTLGNTGTLTGANRNLTISGAGNTVLNRGIATGSGTLTKEGAGTLTLNAANTHTGATTIAAGRITAGAAGLFADAASLTINTGAVYDMAGFGETIGSLQSAPGAGGSINCGGATLTLAAGASSFGGDFGFSNGTIVINAGQSLTLTDSFSAANINIILNGGTLNLGSGYTHTFGGLTVNTGTNSVIDFGTTGSTVVEFSTVNVTGAGALNVNNWTDAVDYFLATASPGPQGAGPTNKVVFAGYVGNDTKWLPFGGGNGQLTPVPEPSAYGALMLGGAAGLMLCRRRRRRAAA